MRYLGSLGKTLQFRERERSWACDQAIHGEAPVLEASRQQALVDLVLRGIAIDRGNFRDLAAIEFARERMAGHQDPLRGIGHGFAHAEDATMVGRDEPIAFGKDGGGSQAGDPCCSRQPSCNQLSSGEHLAHVGSFLAALWPVIMARTRLVKPARQTMATCTRRKRTRKFAMKKWIVRADC